MASFTAGVSGITTSTAIFTARFTGGDSDYAKSRYVELLLDGELITYVESAETSGGTNNFSWTITGLNSGTYYTWEATLYYVGTSGLVATSYSKSGSFTTEEEIIVEPWSWTSSNGSATATQTQNAYKVLTGELTADNFSHRVWNDLVDKVVEVKAKYNLVWETRYATYENSKVSAGDTLSATIYNSVKYNIERCASTGYDFVDPEDPLTGSHIIALTTAINNAI